METINLPDTPDGHVHAWWHRPLAWQHVVSWIFGDNIEHVMGRIRYPVFYLLGGLLAALTHILLNRDGPSAYVPCLGASGAISGAMDAYLVLHPGRRVTVLLFRIITQVPGFVAVGIWFLFQLISGLGMIGGSDSGVAYGAHIGGFVVGAVLAKPFLFGREIKPIDVDPRDNDQFRMR